MSMYEPEGEGGVAEFERRREMNEGAHAPASLYDEEGSFSVRVVHQSDCEERLASTWTSLRDALAEADEVRARLSQPWRDRGLNPRAHVLVDVIDNDDPERHLDWEVLD